MRLRRSRIARIAVLWTLAAAAVERPSAQSELVVYKEGTKLYHRASCAVVLDMKGVIAMTRAQAESRGYTAHPECDPANPAAVPPGTVPAKPQTVYVNETKYYHRKDCKRLEAAPKDVRAESLDVAGRSHWPCPDCRPPVRPRNRKSEPLGRVR